MAYVADPTDVNRPTENEFVYGDAELRALKAYLQTLPAVTNNNLMPVRQTVLVGRQDTATVGAPANYIEAGAGLNAILRGASTPFITAYAAGFTNKGAVDYGVSNATDVTVALAGNRNNFIYSQRASDTGLQSFGADYIPPQYVAGGVGISPAHLLHFDGDLVDAYGGPAWTGVSVTYASGKFSSGVVLNGTTAYVENPSVYQLNQQKTWCKEFNVKLADTSQLNQTWYQLGINDTTGYGVALTYNAGTADTKFALYVSSNGTSWNIANAVKTTGTYASTSALYAIAIEFDGSSYKVYIDGVLVITAASSSAICGVSRELLGCGINGTGQTNFAEGTIDEFRTSAKARYLGGYTPATNAFVIDEQWAVFDTVNYVMKLKGFNPATVQRVYHGEAVTDGASVISVLTYALQGKAVVDIAYATGTVTSGNHNIGAPAIFSTSLLNVIAEWGYAKDDEVINIPNYFDGTNKRNYEDFIDSKTITHHQESVVAVYSKTTNGYNAATSGSWKWRFKVQRGF